MNDISAHEWIVDVLTQTLPILECMLPSVIRPELMTNTRPNYAAVLPVSELDSQSTFLWMRMYVGHCSFLSICLHENALQFRP